MPDLIIKPTNTSGNKVIIQDQAGGAVLTTADSGATLSNVTVTSGNLSNTSIVYPTGHILQTKHDVYVPTSATTITTTAGDFLGADMEVNITPTSTSNFLHVTCYISNVYNLGNAGRAVSAGFRYSAASNFGSPTLLGQRQWLAPNVCDASGRLLTPMYYEAWVSPPNTNQMWIRPWLRREGDANCVIFTNASSGGDFEIGNLSVQEIKG